MNLKKLTLKYKQKKIFISVSGGRTSVFMAKLIKDKYEPLGYKVLFVFANTGQEHEETLKFMHQADETWGLGTIWVEAVVHHGQRKGCTHRIVNYKTACRDGSIFEEMAKKYGIPSKPTPFCTRELKVNPLKSYLRSVGWKRHTYITAIGLRADEMDRVSEKFQEEFLWYPLINMDVKKEDVLVWWKEQPFDLRLPEHLGNCTWCWKKSLRKLLTLAKHQPEIFDVPMLLEEKYRFVGPKGIERFLFREKWTTKKILEAAQGPFEEFEDLDSSHGCTESCEAILTNYDDEEGQDMV